MKILITLALVALGIVGCATPGPTYDDTMKTWLGAPVERLISRLGPPTKEYKTENAKYLTYEINAGSVVMPVMGMYAAVPRSCSTTFQINSIDLIESYSFRGNACQ